MYDFSIICPVYKMKDQLCEKFLVEYLSNLAMQTFKNFEVVVSDQSEDDLLKNICNVFSYALNIKHVRNLSTVKNAAANVNFAINYATGKIIKLLYVDDFFTRPDALEVIKKAFDEKNGKWLISGFVHCNDDRSNYYDARKPSYNDKRPLGDNTTGNPSNYSVRRECVLMMDEKLQWIVDGEYFYRSYYYYDDPIIVDDILVCFREHKASAFLDPEFRKKVGLTDVNNVFSNDKEKNYITEKYNKLPAKVLK